VRELHPLGAQAASSMAYALSFKKHVQALQHSDMNSETLKSFETAVHLSVLSSKLLVLSQTHSGPVLDSVRCGMCPLTAVW
jgi:hypothetical protein